MHKTRMVTGLWIALGLAGPALAQWNPNAGEWNKDDANDLRFMTWNVKDNICSTTTKQEGQNAWTGIARILAGLKPDFVLLQETGDNEGNGSGSNVDSVADLETTIDLLLHGGIDVFNAGNPQVTAWVQKYAPNYDLPYVYVSTLSDGNNRNTYLSRFPFADLNGNGTCCLQDIPPALGDLYAPGGGGGVRGFQLLEIDLEDSVYCGDLVIGGCHLKAYSDPQSQYERILASQNVAYVLDYWYNGGGAGVPDPNGRVYDRPPATHILDDYTPIVIGGDWNEDELTNGRYGPANWLTRAEHTGGNDGTDRDRSDMTYDSAVEFFSGSRATFGSGSKLDYLAWQDSIVTLRHQFVFNSFEVPAALLPPEVQGFPNPIYASIVASDHRAVLIDLIPPQVANGDCDACVGYTTGDTNGDGTVNAADIDPFVLALTDPNSYIAQYGQQAFLCQADANGDGVVNAGDIDPFVQILTGL